jgi:LysM repeat protein
MSTQSVGKLGEPYTNLPPIYQTQSFDEDAFKQAELKSQHGTLASKRDVRRFNRYMKSDAGIKALESAKTAHNAAENQKWSSSYSDYAAAIAEQSKARMLAAKQGFDNAVAAFDKSNEEVKSPETSVESKPPLKPKWSATNANVETGNNTYTVQSGNTLGQIVADYNKKNGTALKWQDVAKWNNIDPSKMRIGQVINFADPTSSPATPVDTAKLASRDTAKVAVADTNKISQPIDTTKAVAVDSSKVNKNTPQIVSSTESTTESTPNFDLDDFWMNNDDAHYSAFGGTDYVRYDPKGFGDFYVDKDGRIYEATLGGAVGKEISQSSTLQHTSPYYHDTKRGKAYRALRTLLTNSGAVLRKQGGTMNRINYFQ